jgi:hypothetical protein
MAEHEELDDGGSAEDAERGRSSKEPWTGEDDRVSTARVGLPLGWPAAISAWNVITWDARRLTQIRAMPSRFDHLGQRVARLHGGHVLTKVVSPGTSNFTGLGRRPSLLFADFGKAWPTMQWQGVFKTEAYLSTLAERAGAALPGMVVPANLSSLSVEDWDRLQEFSREEGLVLAWVPRPALVEALLRAPDAAAREQLLLMAEADVLEDCDACLDEVTHPDMMELAGFVRQAVASYRGGCQAPAQALATNVVETIARHHLHRAATLTFTGKGVSQRIKAAFGEPLGDDVCLRVWRFELVGSAVFAAYREDYDYQARGSAYNRHGTVHCVNPSVYRPVNALRAVLLATALLRLMTEELSEQEQAA